MAIRVEENISLKEHTTFGMGGTARYFVEITNKDDIPELISFATSKSLPLMLLGKGSNVVFGDGVIEKCFASINLKGIEVVSETDAEAIVHMAAGEIWDEAVAWSVEQGLSGIEAMSAIPGTIGATPVQNVGAYGQEIKDTLVEVNAYDIKTNTFVTLSKVECHFDYRTSIFNTTEKGRYIILNITLRLSKLFPSVPHYPGVRAYFDSKKITTPTLSDIRNAIVEIRASKLPYPSLIANVGSFFKNVLITKEEAGVLKNKYEDMPSFQQPDGKIKVPSGWLIEKAGLKGKSFGNISIYDKNALVLTHNGQGSFKELLAVRDEIIETVKKEFGITLEHEPLLMEK